MTLPRDQDRETGRGLTKRLASLKAHQVIALSSSVTERLALTRVALIRVCVCPSTWARARRAQTTFWWLPWRCPLQTMVWVPR